MIPVETGTSPKFILRPGPGKAPRHDDDVSVSVILSQNPGFHKTELFTALLRNHFRFLSCPAGTGRPGQDDQYFMEPLKFRSKSRLWSFFAMLSRLSYFFLPWARPISTFTREPLK